MDYENNGQQITQPASLDGPIAWCHVMYALHAISAISGIMTSAFIITAFITGWPSIIAVLINWFTRNNVKNTWLDSHWRWQMRSFWWAVLWVLIAGAFAITFIGIPVALVVVSITGLWVLYRVVRGWLALLAKRGLPLPG